MHRRNGLFWGAILIVAGLLFLLDSLNLLPVSAWGLLWPLFLILLGLWILMRGNRRFGSRWGDDERFAGFGHEPRPVDTTVSPMPASVATPPPVDLATGAAAPSTAQTAPQGRQVAIPLGGARQAQVRLEHGAGRLHVDALADPTLLLTATGQRELVSESRQDGATAVVRLHPEAPDGFPFNWGPGDFDIGVSLNSTVPLELDVRGGAAETQLDLNELQVSRLYIETGASSTAIRLPQHAGYTRVDVHAGAASVEMIVPQGVAARIQSKGGLSSTSVDTSRFPATPGGYQSSDYETAANKVDIATEMGMGSVAVR